MKKPKYKMLFNEALIRIQRLLMSSAKEHGFENDKEYCDRIKQLVIDRFNALDPNLNLKNLPNDPRREELLNKEYDVEEEA